MSDHWKALADRLGAPGLEPSTRRAREASRIHADPQPSPTDDSPAAGDSMSSPPRDDVSEPSASSDMVPSSFPTESTEPEVTKKKKRSNWERVASLFGLAPQPESEEAAISESPEATLPPIESSEPRLPSESKKPSPKHRAPKSPSTPTFNVSGLFETSPEEDVNPALAEMFGQTTSAYSDNWEKPTRMVDDVGWDQPDDQWLPTAESELPPSVPSLEADSPISESDIENDEEDFPRKRSRRRRRRGGKRTDREPGSASDRNEVGSDADSRSGSDFDSGLAAQGDMQPMRDDLTESELPERRSPRRRHRRTLESSDAQPRDPVEPSPRESDSYYSSPRSESERKPEKEEGGSFSGRRRQRRTRGGSAQNERPQAAERPSDDFSEPNPLVDEMTDDDDQLSSRAEHRTGRNIPTWDETLSVLISGNLENHRRNENRGSRGSGRPRGRR